MPATPWGFSLAFMTGSPSPQSRSSLMTRRTRSSASTLSSRQSADAVSGIRSGAPAPTGAAEAVRPVMRVAELPFDRVLAYDWLFFPAPRPAFLSLWLTPRLGVALAMRDGDRIVGLGAIRACRQGF